MFLLNIIPLHVKNTLLFFFCNRNIILILLLFSVENPSLGDLVNLKNLAKQVIIRVIREREKKIILIL